MSAVVFLTVFPIQTPKHGGQIRVANLCALFNKQGVETSVISVFPAHFFPSFQNQKRCYTFSASSPFYQFNGHECPFCEDYLSGLYGLSQADTILQDLPDNVSTVFCEHPWLWDLALEIRKKHPSAKLVLSQHNVELPLKRSMLQDLGKPLFEDVLQAMDDLERRATRQADLVMAVSDTDAHIFKSWGARDVVVCPNGTRRLPKDLSRPQIVQSTPYVCIIDNNHPSNVIGYFDCLGYNLTFIPPWAKLVTIGDISSMIENNESYRVYHKINTERTLSLGHVSQHLLDALRLHCRAILLPTASNGSPNLKMAEAISSGKPVITTPQALRGFESFKDLPQLKICDSPKAFRQTVREALTHDWNPTSHPVETLFWDHCFAPLFERLKTS